MKFLSKILPTRAHPLQLEFLAFSQFVVLDEVKFTKPTLYSGTFTRLEDLREQSWRTNHQFDTNFLHVLDDLSRLVTSEVEHIENFELANIDSMSASKSFSDYRNGERTRLLHDVKAWSEILYESDWMGYSSQKHFEENERHVLREGIGESRKLRIRYYDWHNRNLWVNSGGSHHTAALIRQMNDQGRTLPFSADVTRLSINPQVLSGQREDCYIFIAEWMPCRQISKDVYPLKTLLKNYVGAYASTNLTYNSPLHLHVIPKMGVHVAVRASFDKWYSEQVAQEKLVDFFSFINDPRHYLI